VETQHHFYMVMVEQFPAMDGMYQLDFLVKQTLVVVVVAAPISLLMLVKMAAQAVQA
jgi:hypothetical protein